MAALPEDYLRFSDAFARLGYRLYLGTVPHAVKQRRRAANRVARRSRKVNR